MLDLFPYQDEGATFLSGRRRALLFDDPGLGKTIQSIEAANRLGAISHHVICPAAVRAQWMQEIHKHGVTPLALYRSYGYEEARDKGLPDELQVLTLDELHYLKNYNSARTAAILGQLKYGVDGIIDRAGYVWGMTGTPSPHDPSDLYPAMHAIVPGSLAYHGGTLSHWQFQQKFCSMYDSGRGMVATGGKNLAELKDRLAPYMLRRTKKEARKDWKEPLLTELWLGADAAGKALAAAELEPEARLVADAFVKGGFEALKVLAQTERTGVTRYRRYVGMLKVLPIVKWLLEELDNGGKFVVIAWHREVLEAISEKLTEQTIGNVVFYGGMTDKQKEAAKKDFITNPKCRVFNGQLLAAGTGTDGLQTATGRVILVEASWISDDNYQTISRLDRIGQTEPVLGQFVCLEGSLDGAIMATAARRARENKQLFG